MTALAEKHEYGMWRLLVVAECTADKITGVLIVSTALLGSPDKISEQGGQAKKNNSKISLGPALQVLLMVVRVSSEKMKKLNARYD